MADAAAWSGDDAGVGASFWHAAQFAIAPPTLHLTREGPVSPQRLPLLLNLLAARDWPTVRHFRLDDDSTSKAYQASGHSSALATSDDLVDDYLAGLLSEGQAIESVRAVIPDILTDDELTRKIQDYTSAGFLMCDYAWAHSSLGPTTELLVFGHEVLLRRTFDQATRASLWKLSGNRDEVTRALQTWDTLANGPGIAIRPPHEPLLATCDFIASIAQVSCSSSYVDEQACSWYHGAWQYLRLTDQVSTPRWHGSFFYKYLVEELEAFEPVRILISGTADYSMLAQVLRALERARGKPAKSDDTVVIVDQCPTPLAACTFFATWRGLPFRVETVQARLEDFASQQQQQHSDKFDIICTDAFLTRFDPAGARAVVRAWRGILSDHGVVLTTVRVNDSQARHNPQERARLRDGFVTRAYERSQMWAPFLRVQPPDISIMAEMYARRMQSQRYTEKQVVKLLNEHFELRTIRRAPVAGELEPTTYLEFVAEVRAPNAAPTEPPPVANAEVAAEQLPRQSWKQHQLSSTLLAVLPNIEAQGVGDEPWGGNFASIVFAAQVLSRVQLSVPFGQLDRWVEGRFTIDDAGELKLPSRRSTAEGEDFDRIRDFIAAESPTQAEAIDLDRFHRNWAAGLLLCHLASRLRLGVETSVANLEVFVSRLRGSEFDPRVGLFYPTDVPWVTTRLLTGLIDLIDVGVDSPEVTSVATLAAAGLLRRIPLSGLVPSGTGEWNPTVSVSATAASALSRSHALLDPVDKITLARKVTATAHRLDEARAEWDPAQSPLACAEVLVALRRAEARHGQHGHANATNTAPRPFARARYYAEEQQLSRWVLDRETWQLANASAAQQNDESSRVAYVVSLLSELLSLGGAAESNELTAAVAERSAVWRDWTPGIDPATTKILDGILAALRTSTPDSRARQWEYVLSSARDAVATDRPLELDHETLEALGEAADWLRASPTPEVENDDFER